MVNSVARSARERRTTSSPTNVSRHRSRRASSIPGVVAPFDRARDGVEQVDDRAVGVEQAGGLLDDVLEQVARLADRGDPGGDLAEALLGFGPPGDLAPGAVQLLDQAGVLDGDRGLVRERADDVSVVVVERLGLGRIDLQGAERTGLAADRGDDHRPEAGDAEEAIVDRRLWEERSRLVAGHDDPALGNGDAARADPDRDVQLGQLIFGEPLADPRVVRPAKDVRAGLDEVEDRAVATDQAARRVDDLLEQRAPARGSR